MSIRSHMETSCRHFTGIQHEACEKGINYMSMRQLPAGGGMAQWPCTEPKLKHLCPFWEVHSDEEIAETEREFTAALDKILKLEAAEIDVCPDCGAKIEHMQQVGRCVYADPCGHRLWQGKIPPAWKDRALPKVEVEGDWEDYEE